MNEVTQGVAGRQTQVPWSSEDVIVLVNALLIFVLIFIHPRNRL
jgi:hypothetical protein